MTSDPLLKRIFNEHMRPYTKRFLKAACFMVLGALATAALPFLLQPVFDEVFQNPTLNKLIFFCSAIFMSFVIKGASSYGEAVIMTSTGQKIISDIQKRLFRHYMKADLNFFHSNNSGDLISRFTQDVTLMRNAVATTMVGLGKDLITLLCLVGLMFYRDWILASFAFFILPSVAIPVAKLGRKMKKVTHSTQEETGHFLSYLSQIFQGIRVVKTYRQESYETKKAAQRIDAIYELICKTTRARSAVHPVVESLGGLAISVVIAYGGWQVIESARTTGEFMSFVAALILAYEPIKRLSQLNSNIQEGLGAAQRVFDILDTKPRIESKPQRDDHISLKGNINFKDVTFSYNQDTVVLDKLSFDVEKGHSIAFVGPSGAGKSTIINLIPRFFDIQSGNILLDNHDIQSLSIPNLRDHIALVSQEISLFNRSIFDNISYANHRATKEQVIEAAKKAAAHDFIEKLPNGYNTLVGENGVMLSGGQRQRLSIARALLKDAPILLLDEATSALDTESEKQIQKALKNLMKGRTTIIVAHRLSTITHVDQIYVIDQGRILEQGTHDSLLKNSILYKSLWEKQYH